MDTKIHVLSGIIFRFYLYRFRIDEKDGNKGYFTRTGTKTVQYFVVRISKIMSLSRYSCFLDSRIPFLGST
jgi:hypothetical protein